jgi:hypothetical protein
MDRGVVPTNQNPRLTRLRQPRSVRGDRGDREGRIGPSWVSTIGVQVQPVGDQPIKLRRHFFAGVLGEMKGDDPWGGFGS